MSEIRNTLRLHRLPSGLALIVLSVLLFCGQIAETAHAEVECEHESCSLCVGSASDNTLVADDVQHIVPQCEQRIAAPASTNFLPALQAQAQHIRGPPAL